MERKLQKTEIKGYSKDEGNRAMLRTDVTALDAYKKKKMQITRVDTMEIKLNNIEEELIQIKGLLEKIANG